MVLDTAAGRISRRGASAGYPQDVACPTGCGWWTGRRGLRRAAMRELRTEIDIAAPPELVWAVLTSFDASPDWNPFMRSISGRCEAGSRLTVRIEPPGARAMTFKPTILTADPAR